MSRPYVTSIERSGIEKGVQQGMQKGLERGLAAERALLRRLTLRRFGERCAEQLERLLESVDEPDRLAEVGEWIIDCDRAATRSSRGCGNGLLRVVHELLFAAYCAGATNGCDDKRLKR